MTFSDRITRTLPSAASLVVGAASFALSFVALRDVAASTQAVPEHLAWLVPVVIDGGVIGGSAVIWANSRLERRRQVFPFLFIAALVSISVVVNVNHAGPSLLAKVIAGLPPLVLLGTLELVAAQHRRESSAPVAVAQHAPAPASRAEQGTQAAAPARRPSSRAAKSPARTAPAKPARSRSTAPAAPAAAPTATQDDALTVMPADLPAAAMAAPRQRTAAGRKQLRVAVDLPVEATA